ncbi:MAG: hypothetical protein LBL33_10795 [Tannerella sp.]|jgi:hypothetical protein|nr:hypothetical protein [Tannerella sp.]
MKTAASKTLRELKLGTWFRMNGSREKCKYFGEAELSIYPQKVYLFIRENGQGYFIQNGERSVSVITDYNFGRYPSRIIPPSMTKIKNSNNK